eukprot:gene4836-5623_t
MSQNRLEPGSSLHQYYDLCRVKKKMEEQQSLWLDTVYEGKMGRVNSSYTDGGTEFTFADYRQQIHTDTLIHSQVSEHSSVEMTFLLHMDKLMDQIDGKFNAYHSMQQNIHYVAPGSQVKLFCEKGKRYHNFDVYIDLKSLIKWELPYKPLDTFINAILNRKTAKLFPEDLPVNAATMALLNDIRNCRMKGVARDIYMKAKVFELLSHQIDCHEKRKNEPRQQLIKNKYQLGPYDLDLIQKIAGFLEKHADAFTSIHELSRIYGMNEHKLKNGFKAVYGKALFEYAQDIRMNRAKNLLLSTNRSVKEIAYETGYKTPAAFTAAFKRYFDLLPRDLKEQNQLLKL